VCFLLINKAVIPLLLFSSAVPCFARFAERSDLRNICETFNPKTVLNLQITGVWLMDQAKPKLNLKMVLLPLVGVLVFFLYIYIFNVDLLNIINNVKRAQPLPYLAAVLVGFLEIFFYAVSWREILSGLKVNLSFVKSYLFVLYGMFMDILVPAESVSGEICRLRLVNKEHCGASGRVIASLVTYRLLSMVMNSVFLLVGAAMLFGLAQIDPVVFDIILFLVIGIVVLMTILITLCWKENWSVRAIKGAIRIGEFLSRGKWNLQKIQDNACNTAKNFHISMKDVIRNPKKLAIPTLYLALNWLASMSIPYLVFLSLGFDVSWGVIFVTTSIVIAIKSIPVGIPFEVGLPEIAMTTLYASVGIPPGIAATSTILSRVITLWFRFGIGFAAYQWVEIKTLPNNRIQLGTATAVSENAQSMK